MSVPPYESGQPACLSFSLLDPYVARELGIVAAHLLDEPLDVLASDKRLKRIPEREWARLDSNQGPTDYESAALTS